MENTNLKSHPFYHHQMVFIGALALALFFRKLSTVVKQGQGILKNKCVLAVFLDIKGAFDNASSEATRKAMEDHDNPKMISSW
jgi:hypothetical protein